MTLVTKGLWREHSSSRTTEGVFAEVVLKQTLEVLVIGVAREES
jgi:hypothetical protein